VPETTLTRCIPNRRRRSLRHLPAILGAGALAVAVLGLFSCSHSRSSDSQAARSQTDQTKVEVGVETVERKDLVRTIELPGTLVAFNQATLYGKVAGYLRSIRVDKGDWVRRGQILAVLEVPEMVDAVDQARAAYQQALADVSRAKAQADLQSVTYQRFREVHAIDPDAVANQELDEYRSKFEVAEADVKLGQARVATARASLNRSIALNQYASITAPFSGVITARYVDPGALI
jgi:membrane fusion protein (multidrug efflux system)